MDAKSQIQQQYINSNVTLFYSNYSGNCKALLQRIKNLNSKLSIKYINIDNKHIRNIVTKKFDVVPTIVVMLNDEISLYTGSNAFEWFNLIDNIMIGMQHTKLPNVENKIQPECGSSNVKKSVSEIAAEFSKIREQIIPENKKI